MNPRTKFDEADNETVRAFVELFNRHGEDFDFYKDRMHRSDHEEGEIWDLSAQLVINDNVVADGRSTITVSATDMHEEFQQMVEAVEELGLTVLEQMSRVEDDDNHGEVQVDTLTCVVEEDIDEDWNLPTFIFYGSLSPEIEECIRASIGNSYELFNVRNHVVVRGQGLTEDEVDTISDRVSQSSSVDPEWKSSIVSDIRTGSLV